MTKKKTKEKRTLKVYAKYSMNFNRNFKILPEIRLKGEWQRQCGYERDDQIQIHCMGENIIIRKGTKLPTIRL